MAESTTYVGDCLTVLDTFVPGTFDLIYLDPPFFTQKQHTLAARDGSATFTFRDVWASHEEYACFLHERLQKMHRVLSPTGSLFFHCDSNAVHIARLVLDQIFGAAQFQSEIVWSYKRWSNAGKGLLPAHQTILFYAKSADFKFNTTYVDYSASTNIDQITQRRVRDARNKAVYARDEQGVVLSNGPKKGVPLSDVWDIPFLNPKAKERVGYPTQKPVLLLERIIALCTEAGDRVCDPFCGSGTTLVAASLLGRHAVGIDIAPEAIELTNRRMQHRVKTESSLLQKGRSEYVRKDTAILQHLVGLDCHIVQRNQGLDAILNREVAGKAVFIRIQRLGETLLEAANALRRASLNKGNAHLVLVMVDAEEDSGQLQTLPDVSLVRSTSLTISDLLRCLSDE